jgi:restriction endonuclease Mrr
VKHWLTKAVGTNVARRFVEVVTGESAEKGLLLATSGFTRTVAKGVVAAQARRVFLGGKEKVTSLFQAYVRLGQGLWLPADGLEQELMRDTRPLSES